VPVRQRKAGGRMVERRRVPTDVVVAGAALCDRKALRGARVRRVVGLLPGGEVAAGVSAVVIGNSGEVVVVVDMACRTRDGGVRAIEEESSYGVVESSTQPAVEALVAVLTIIGGKGRTGARVRRIRGLLPVLQVAALAVGRKTEENPRRRLPVAVLALHCRVRTEQGEAILVFFYLLRRDGPALNRMAFLAV